MFGPDYPVMDQSLAKDGIDRAQYASELLGELLERPVLFGALIDDHVNHGTQSLQDVIYAAGHTFRGDVSETCDRARGAGLSAPQEAEP